MPSCRLTRSIASWLAMLAILMAALAPAVSQALGTQGVAAWVEVCSAEGSTWVQTDAGVGDDSGSGDGHMLEHCPYCSIHPNVAGIPPAPLQALPAAELAHAVPLAFLAAPRTLHAWVSAQPRAPPQFS